MAYGGGCKNAATDEQLEKDINESNLLKGLIAMKLRQTLLILTISFVCTGLNTYGAEELASEEELYNRKREAFANPKKDNPDLPNVLLFGDSISIGYTPYVRRLISEKADLYRIPTNVRHSSYGLENLDKWLELKSLEWDVIHFNWGLWDLCSRHRKAKTQGHRDKVNGALTSRRGA